MTHSPDDMGDDDLENILEQGVVDGLVEVRVGPGGERLWNLTPAGVRYVEELIATNPEAKRLLNKLKKGSPS